MGRRPEGNSDNQIKKRGLGIFYKGGFVDYAFIFLVIFLVAFGVVMIYSTSSYTAELKMGDAAYFMKRQGLFAVLGIVAMLVVGKMDYHFFKKFSLVLMYGIIVALIAVLIFGEEKNGATRWIEIGSIGIQPSEFAKLIIILYTAHAVTIHAARITDLKVIIRPLIWPIAAVGLIAKENLSTAIICAAIVAMIVFITSPKVKEFFLLALGLIVMLAIFLVAQPYRLERLQIWFHPEEHEKGYQILQALYAIGSGGLFGKGLGQSIQKLGFIPESHNDMIFSVICEELGVFGAICVIAIFVLLIWKCVTIAVSAPDLYGALLVVGVITHISVQVIVNMAVVTKLLPPTGVPLPFISYGGTAIAGLLVEMGIVLSVARQIRMAREY